MHRFYRYAVAIGQAHAARLLRDDQHHAREDEVGVAHQERVRLENVVPALPVAVEEGRDLRQVIARLELQLPP